MGADHGFICRTCRVRWLAEEGPPHSSPTWRAPTIPDALLRHREAVADIGRALSEEVWGDFGPLGAAVTFLAAHEGHDVASCDEYEHPEQKEA